MGRFSLRDPAFLARSAPSGPTLTITSGLIARWESDNITGLNDGDAVASWPDTSGSSRTAAQGTGANKPLFKTNIFGTKPAVRFDGSNDELTFTPSSIPNGWTVFGVFTVRSFAAYGGLLSWRAASTAGFLIMDHAGNASAWTVGYVRTDASNAETKSEYNGDTLATPFPSGPAICMVRYNHTGTIAHRRKNGAAISGFTQTGNFGLTTLASIGRGYAFMNVDVGALLVYDNALSDSDAGTVFTYLNSKFAIY